MAEVSFSRNDPKSIALVDEAVAATRSMRGALFAVRNSFSQFTNSHLGFEILLGKKHYIRHDLINPTTFPPEVGAMYLKSGGPPFDPVVAMAAAGAETIWFDARKLIESEPQRYRHNGFLKALIDIGCPNLASYCLPEFEQSSVVVLSAVYGEQSPFNPDATDDWVALARAILSSFRRHGRVSAYFGLNKKELDCLRSLSTGKSAVEMASEHALTTRAIELRLQKVRQKLRSRTSTEAVYKATAYGLI